MKVREGTAMNEKIMAAYDETLEYISELRAKYENVTGMQGLIAYLNEEHLECETRRIFGELDESWLAAVRTDIRRTEYNCKAEAGLLTPEQAAARNELRAMFLGKCDLPDWVR